MSMEDNEIHTKVEWWILAIGAVMFLAAIAAMVTAICVGGVSLALG